VPALPKSAKRQARRAIETYRVIYRIEPPDVVLIVKIGHRREPRVAAP